ncbi:MAG: flavin reductase family protein [Oscillospiraceae bacterium]
MHENFNKIDITAADFNPFSKIGTEWFLLASGNEERYNMMTCSWGFAGVVWNKNAVIALVRPQRFTKELIDSNDLFTLSFFGSECRKELGFCGCRTGRDTDKAKETGLTPVFSDSTVFFKQAHTVLVCKKLYHNPLTPAGFSVPRTDHRKLPRQRLPHRLHRRNPHRLYKVIAFWGALPLENPAKRSKLPCAAAAPHWKPIVFRIRV